MNCVIIVGSQWGDEGKGKIVDLLTEYADGVIRYQGGTMLDTQLCSKTKLSFYT